MGINSVNFTHLTHEENNPFLTAFDKGMARTQNFLKFPQELQKMLLENEIKGIEAKYAEPKAKELLIKDQLYNKYYPQDILSQIGLRGSQGAQAQANAGLLGEQEKYYGKKTESDIRLQNNQGAQAQANAGLLAEQEKYYGKKTESDIRLQNNQGAQAQANAGLLAEQEKYYGKKTESDMLLQRAIAREHLANADKMQILVDELKYSQQNKGNKQNNNLSNNSQPQENSPYGIETPTPTREDIVNKNLYGLDTYTPKLKNAKEEQIDQYKQYQQVISSLAAQSNAANETKQLVSLYNANMDKSFYRGSRLGGLQSSGFFRMPGDMSPEQSVDRISSLMVVPSVARLRDAMGSARFSNLDMNMASQGTLDRTLDDDARKLKSAWINGVSERISEQAKFYNKLGNPNMGVKKTDADILWSQYQNDFPLISQDGNKFMGENLGKWALYTTPKAIESIKRTGSYSPSASEAKVTMMQYPDGTVLPVARGKVETAIKLGGAKTI
jgi:hypothetical protein